MIDQKYQCTCSPAVDSGIDKYDLDLRFRPCHRQKVDNAKHCDTVKEWNCQSEENLVLFL